MVTMYPFGHAAGMGENRNAYRFFIGGKARKKDATRNTKMLETGYY
jgi:hypothetical protein